MERTRRWLLQSGAGAAGALPLTAWSNPALAAIESSAGKVAKDQDQAAVPAFSDYQRHFTVQVSVNGQGPFRFVVDTGADRTVLSADVAQKLGLPTGEGVLIEGIVRTIPAGTSLVRELQFGPVRRENMVVPLLARELIGADGYLGLDAIDGYAITFDFIAETLNVALPREPFLGHYVGSNVANVPATGGFGHLRALTCEVDGVSATAFLDSGAEVTIGNHQLASALSQKDSVRHAQIGIIPVTGVTGGVLQGQLTTIDEIRMKALTFRTSGIVIADLQIFDLWGLSDTPALLIGMNYLREFSKVTIDYGRREFRFQLADLSAGFQRA